MNEEALNAQALTSIAEHLLDEPDVPHTAGEVVRFALHTLGFDYGGVTLLRARGRLETVGASDDLVHKVDAWQYDLREGPCYEAAWEQRIFACSDLIGEQDRWPTWVPRVVETGVRGLLSVEMGPNSSRLGALNLYSTRQWNHTEDAVAFAQLFARHAAVALVNAQRIESLSEAVDARTLVGQAQGILMERFCLDADQAFAVLRRYSQDHNIRLRNLSEQLVQTRLLPGAGSDRTSDGTAGS